MSLAEFTRFMNDAAALEKTLRLLQGIAQLAMSIFASMGGAADLVDISGTLRKHFALGRRYFRFFKWVDCALAAADAIRGDESGGREGILALLNVAKWSYLGMFLLTEAVTIIDAMGLRKSSWAPMLFIEAMRFWFYSISCSIVLVSYDLYMNRAEIAGLEQELGDAEPSMNRVGNGTAEKAKAESKPDAAKDHIPATRQGLRKAKCRRHVLVRQLIGSCCDLLTPAPVVNYIPAPPAVVAVTSIMSSLISTQDIWRRVNSR